MNRRLSRRGFLRGTGLFGLTLAGAGAAGVLGGCVPILTPEAPATAEAPTAAMTAQPATEVEQGITPDLEIALRAAPGEVSILPGASTAVWRYIAEVLRGDPASVVSLPDSFLGPVLRVRQGQRVRIHFINELPESSIVHWHGLLVPEEMDGHPRFAVNPGATYVYDFQVINRAGTYWFHPHPHGLTGGQVYRGLAGLFIVSDEEEAALGLPQDDQDIPLVIQDRVFDERNQFAYIATDGHGMMGGMMGSAMDQMMGFLGDQILVNGRRDYAVNVATRAYRLRLLNGSNSRIYKLGFRDGSPLTVIATDGGLLPAPVERPFVTLAPGERAELWVDFSRFTPGDVLHLDSLAFVGAEGDELAGASGGMNHDHMSGTMMRATALRNGDPFPVARFAVAREETAEDALPERLTPITSYRLQDAVNPAKPWQVAITNQMMTWLLNGRSFEMEEVAPDETAHLGDLVCWEFVNERNPGQMMEQNGMAHPMHVHGTQFQVVERRVIPELEDGVASVRDGYVDEGWKDTVLLMPGERVKVLLRFAHPGLFLYHCHTLEHEDQGLMRNLRIEG